MASVRLALPENRRSNDLVNQRLLLATLQGDVPPSCSLDDLQELVSRCTEQEQSTRELERQIQKSVASKVGSSTTTHRASHHSNWLARAGAAVVLCAMACGIVPAAMAAPAAETAQTVMTSTQQTTLPAHMIGTTVDSDLAQRAGVSNADLFADVKELGFNTVRLGANWRDIQPDGSRQPDFSRLDAQIAAAQKAGLKVVLMTGAKSPGAFGYYVPDWATPHPSALDVSTDASFTKSVTNFDRLVVQHYADNPTVVMWEAEDQASDTAGPDSWRIGTNLVGREIATIRQNDPMHRPVMVTFKADTIRFVDMDPKVAPTAQMADVIGVSMHPGDAESMGAQQEFAQRVHDYGAAQGKRVIISELPSGYDQSQEVALTPDQVSSGFKTAVGQGFGDILFSDQSRIEHDAGQKNMTMILAEHNLANSILNPTAPPATVAH